MNKWPKVAIIVLNWNRWQDTIECLRSIEKLIYPNYEVILLDNGSADDSVSQLTEWVMKRSINWGSVIQTQDNLKINLPLEAKVVLRTSRLTLIHSEGNLGFANGCNLAIDYVLTQGPSVNFLFLLNNDARVHPDCLNKLVFIAQTQEASIVGAVIMSEDGREVISVGARFPLELFTEWRIAKKVTTSSKKYNTAVDSWPIDRVEGAGMLIHRRLVEQRKAEVGYVLDPKLFVYGEEVELCIWARQRGHKVLVAGEAIVYHRIGGSLGTQANFLAYYYTTRNYVYLAKKFLPTWVRILFHLWYIPFRVAKAIMRILRGKPKVAAAIIEGLMDGYRGITGKWSKHPDMPVGFSTKGSVKLHLVYVATLLNYLLQFLRE